ncbi:RICIN domain-containing protein [Desertivirga brevis]|uniref:RICIN domain-containing protein n=1 Tax=Desertivirga brevis TaxID=2810310 RepID=UPI001A972FB5|nr:RICIN domain-containing protein [Pedobacter sp. SYSU D00873]
MKFKRKLTLLVAALLVCFGCSKDKTTPENEIEPGPDSKENNSATVSGIGAAGIAGVNWSDARDNFVDGWIIPCGLEHTDSYTTVSAKANTILTGFQTNMPGVNTLRIGINPATVGESWWGAYSGVIDRALSKNMKVIIACWEGASSRNGRIDNISQFWPMWQTVVTKYQGNSNVYFEVFNEPWGYTLSELSSIYVEWLSRYPGVPRGRILLGGTGASQNVTGIGADSRFNGCLLALHNYSFWGNYDMAGWEANWRANYGSYASRTVVTEYGATMTNGKNYNGPIGNDNEIAFIVGATNVFRADGVASVYWAGLWDNDPYAIQTRSGTGTNMTLTTNNVSGLSRIRYAWGEGSSFNSTAYYRLVNRNSGKVLDISGSATTNGASAIQWAWGGGNNQQWQLISTGGGYFRIINRNSGQALDVNQSSTSDGAGIIQWPWNGGYNQQWQIVDIGGGFYQIVNRATRKALDISGSATTDGASAIQWTWGAGNNQQWQIIQQ